MNTLPPHVQDGNAPKYKVYRLINKDRIPFYVGITFDLLERYKKHMRCDGTNVQKDAVIQEDLQSGFLTIMDTIEQVDTFEEALKREAYWIHYYLSIGVLLLNQYVPSSAQGVHSQKLRAVRSGRKFKDDQVKEIIMYRLKQGVWPADLSYDMQSYYHVHYIKRDGKYRAKTREWRAELREHKK